MLSEGEPWENLTLSRTLGVSAPPWHASLQDAPWAPKCHPVPVPDRGRAVWHPVGYGQDHTALPLTTLSSAERGRRGDGGDMGLRARHP